MNFQKIILIVSTALINTYGFTSIVCQSFVLIEHTDNQKFIILIYSTISKIFGVEL